MPDSKTAVLIDAYSQIFRVFYAISHLSRRDGFPTNALFGFARLLLQLEKEYAPTAGAMFFDCGKPEFRLELAPDYKSNRPPMPEELKQQMPLLRELAGLFGWNICQCSNYEADDLIGAAVKSAPENHFAIISSDKDLSQLIDEKTCMLIPSRNGGFEVRNIEATLAKFAVAPCQIIDYLALLGDNSDAIEGVAGIGPKTAAGILQSAGSLEKFFADPTLVSNPKTRDKLLNSQELIKRNRKLIALRTLWPENELGPLAGNLVKRPPDWAKIAGFAREYELKSVLKELLKEFAADVPRAPASAAPPPAAAAQDADDLFSWGEQQEHTGQADRESAGKDSPRPTQGVLF